jgi:uncharacterized protein YndB with AHSA1/START domain
MKGLVINKSIHIDARPEAVFDALTNSDAIVRYYPLKRVTSEWKVGSAVLLDGEIDGQGFRDHGVIRVLSRPTSFSYSYWSTNQGAQRTPENDVTIAYRLSPRPRGTQLDVEQSNLASPEIVRLMSPIWDSLLNRLKDYVEHRA